jgi:RNA polymerase sigma-70 factor (ECF subfamily)
MDDESAIRACIAGDRQAFRHLVERYQSRAIGHAIGILGNREDALDAVQDAFIDAFQALVRFDLSRSFYPWFYVILRNRCYKSVSARRRYNTQSIENPEILEISEKMAFEEVLLLERRLFHARVRLRERLTRTSSKAGTR